MFDFDFSDEFVITFLVILLSFVWFLIGLQQGSKSTEKLLMGDSGYTCVRN